MTSSSSSSSSSDSRSKGALLQGHDSARGRSRRKTGPPPAEEVREIGTESTVLPPSPPAPGPPTTRQPAPPRAEGFERRRRERGSAAAKLIVGFHPDEATEVAGPALRCAPSASSPAASFRSLPRPTSGETAAAASARWGRRRRRRCTATRARTRTRTRPSSSRSRIYKEKKMAKRGGEAAASR